MMPIAPASFSEKSSHIATQKNVRKTPIWAAAPNSINLGFDKHRRKIGHRADAQKDQRRIDALADAEVKIAQHAAGVIDAQRHAFDDGDVADDRAHSDRHQQQRLVVFPDRQRDEHDSDQDHDRVAERHRREAGRLQELEKDIHQISNARSSVAGIALPFPLRSLFSRKLPVQFGVQHEADRRQRSTVFGNRTFGINFPGRLCRMPLLHLWPDLGHELK